MTDSISPTPLQERIQELEVIVSEAVELCPEEGRGFAESLQITAWVNGLDYMKQEELKQQSPP